MGFAAFIRKQKERNDSYGDFSRDFIDVNSADELPRGVNELESETLYGFYKHVPLQFRSDDHIIEPLIGLWGEYLEYKHIGLKFNEPELGYVYFFKVPDKNLFKIGKTKKNPIIRKSQVEVAEKIELDIYNWIKINHYGIIETEIKQALKKFQVQKEWFQFEHYGVTKGGKEFCLEANEILALYSNTDEDCKFYKELYD